MVKSLARDLTREGIEVHVATTDDNGPKRLHVPWGTPVVQDGVTYWFFPRQTRFYTFSWPLSTWLARHVNEFDVLHIHALFSYATLPAAFWANRHGIPYVLRPLGTLNEWGMQNRRPWVKKLSLRLLESRVLKNAALVHYTSELERTAAESLQVGGRSIVIPNALPPSPGSIATLGFRARYPELRDRPIALCLSRLDPVKGLDILLGAFAKTRERIPGVALVVAGDGNRPFIDELKAQADALGLAADVVWTGFLEGHEKQAALADADVFVLPSYSENFGIAVAEAMAAGLPVIVTDQMGIHPDVAQAQAGRVVSCDVDRLSMALVELLADAPKRRQMGDNARRWALEHYSSRAVTRQVIGAYNAIAIAH
jgi:glycosyltransferase involved in cell wall biosynthesis